MDFRENRYVTSTGSVLKSCATSAELRALRTSTLGSVVSTMAVTAGVDVVVGSDAPAAGPVSLCTMASCSTPGA